MEIRPFASAFTSGIYSPRLPCYTAATREGGNMSDCIFCKIADGTIETTKVYESDNVVAFDDANPVSPVHVLVIPKAHLATLNDADASHSEVMGELFLAAKKNRRRQGSRRIGVPHRDELRLRRGSVGFSRAPARPRRPAFPMAARLGASRSSAPPTRPQNRTRSRSPQRGHYPVSTAHRRQPAERQRARRRSRALFPTCE